MEVIFIFYTLFCRSATMCMIYLIAMEGFSLYDAYVHIKQQRGIINPNEGFWQQMMEYEIKKTGDSSVHVRRQRNFDL